MELLTDTNGAVVPAHVNHAKMLTQETDLSRGYENVYPELMKCRHATLRRLCRKACRFVSGIRDHVGLAKQHTQLT